MGGVLSSVAKVFGYDSGAISEAANKQAAATRETGNKQAQALRDSAQSAQRSQETMLAQKQASDAAQELLNKPIDQVEVDVAGPADDVDEGTGKRTKPRDAYSGGGIKI